MRNRRRALLAGCEDLYFLKPANWYTDTGITANSNYCFELGFTWTNTPTNSEYLFGVTNNKHQEYYHSLQGFTQNSKTVMRAYRFNDPLYTNDAVIIAGGKRLDVRLDFTQTYYNLSVNGISSRKSSSNLRDVANTTYYFGAQHCQETTTGIWNSKELKVYYFRIFQDIHATTPLLEYLPKIVNGEVVLYDTVNNRSVTWKTG